MAKHLGVGDYFICVFGVSQARVAGAWKPPAFVCSAQNTSVFKCIGSVCCFLMFPCCVLRLHMLSVQLHLCQDEGSVITVALD